METDLHRVIYSRQVFNILIIGPNRWAYSIFCLSTTKRPIIYSFRKCNS
jgi:hypothetical protein